MRNPFARGARTATAPGRGARPAARGDPGPVPAAALRALDVAVAGRIHGLLPGDQRARELGGGTELAVVRRYEPGDDVRAIDWHVTARTAVPHVRIRVPERAMTTWLVLDTSPSMRFGTAARRKADVAEGVALALGHVATRRGNRLAALTFGSVARRRLAPGGGRGGLLALLLAARDDGARDGGVGDHAASDAVPAPGPALAGALRSVAAAARPGALVVVVSDFRGPRNWLPELAALGMRDHVLAVEVRDPREDRLPDVGELTLLDSETGRQLSVDTTSARLRDAFARAAAAERERLAADFRRIGVGHVVLSTDADWLRSLAGQLARVALP